MGNEQSTVRPPPPPASLRRAHTTATISPIRTSPTTLQKQLSARELYGSGFNRINDKKFINQRNVSDLFPHSIEEYDRCLIRHYALRWAFQSNILPPIEDGLLDGGKKCLDIGCGQGAWLFEMAYQFPASEMVGVDIVPIMASEIKPSNVTFKKVNIVEGLPFEDNYFDLVQMRNFVAALRAHEWPKVVAEIVRVTKPGGWVQLIEAQNNVCRAGTDTTVFFEKMKSLMALRGQEPAIATKLEKYLVQAGMPAVEKKYLSLPIGWGQKEMGEMMLDVILGAAASIKPVFTRVFALRQDEYDRMVKSMKTECTELKSYLNYHAFWAQKPF